MRARDSTTPACYFPIDERPFRMTAGLHRLGHDFGNGSADSQFFQRDRAASEFMLEKSRVLHSHPERLSRLPNVGALTVQHRIFEWMEQQLRKEHALILTSGAARSEREHWQELSLAIQEDFAILHQDEHGDDQLVLLSVCFPSGWVPENLLGAGFHETHAPVPEFDELETQRSRLVHAMIHRGPYVRFVWSVTADPRLDHHPIHAPRDGWDSRSNAYLRVERQVTVPFPSLSASLFLIRTYLYPVESLSPEKRKTLLIATSRLPPTVQRYKGITRETLRVLELAAQTSGSFG